MEHPPSSLDLAATQGRLRRLAADGHLDAQALERAMELAGHVPDRVGWRWMLDRLLLLGGVVLVLAGIVFFFAYNWVAMGPFAKFGLIMGGIVFAVAATWRLGLDTWPGKAALLIAAVLPGPLLAVYGQVYQTGADPYGLFLTWALLIAIWVAVSRFPALWILWLGLVNITVSLYWDQVLVYALPALDPDQQVMAGLLLVLFTLNTVALVAWEAGIRRGATWLRERWAPVLIATAALFCITIAVVSLITTPLDELGEVPLRWVAGGVYLVAVTGAVGFYRRRSDGLVLLALCALSGLVLVTVLAARLVGDWPGGELIVALLVIVQLYGVVTGLRRVHARAEGRQ